MKKKKQNSDLTAREMDVLKEMISGKSNKKIGKTLFITQYTVKAHLTQIYKKVRRYKQNRSSNESKR